jgi:hypothetical protein
MSILGDFTQAADTVSGSGCRKSPEPALAGGEKADKPAIVSESVLKSEQRKKFTC